LLVICGVVFHIESFLKLMSDVVLKGNIYAWFQYILLKYISIIVSHLISYFVFVLLFCKLLNYLMTLFVFLELSVIFEYCCHLLHYLTHIDCLC